MFSRRVGRSRELVLTLVSFSGFKSDLTTRDGRAYCAQRVAANVLRKREGCVSLS